ncbi:MAG: hypothetical protein ACREEC_07655, partial [Thermoplasmata archaeon]
STMRWGEMGVDPLIATDQFVFAGNPDSVKETERFVENPPVADGTRDGPAGPSAPADLEPADPAIAARLAPIMVAMRMTATVRR